MGRRMKVVTITTDGRDIGKNFLLREMNSAPGEWWAIRCLILLANSGATLPAGSLDAGMAGLAAAEQASGLATALLAGGIRMLPGVSPKELRPLLDEMAPCIQYQPAGGLPPQSLLDGEYCQIEEIATWFKLRFELLQLHVGFSLAGALSTTDTTPPAPASS